jgi:hypothetical protein
MDGTYGTNETHGTMLPELDDVIGEQATANRKLLTAKPLTQEPAGGLDRD